ncbi:hypothetical protein, partial [Enterobacter hormaechei]|uniref:hypothetical protein n=1 Tax=Enterobacter hormaechei TaxID=158836 RepID=UPI001954464A
DQTVDVSADRDQLHSRLGLAQQNENFAWFKYCSTEDLHIPAPRNWQNDPQPWVDIASGVMAERVAEAARSFK